MLAQTSPAAINRLRDAWPSRRPPPRPGHQRNEQHQAFEPRQAGQGDRRPRGQVPGPAEFGHGPPQEIEAQRQQEPEGRIANDLDAPADQSRVDRIQNAGGDRHPAAEGPAYPAKQRQDRATGDHHAPGHAGRFPRQAKSMQIRQNKGIDIEADLPQGSLELPRFDRLAQTNVKRRRPGRSPASFQAMIARGTRQRVNRPASTNHSDADCPRAGCAVAGRIGEEVAGVRDTTRPGGYGGVYGIRRRYRKTVESGQRQFSGNMPPMRMCRSMMRGTTTPRILLLPRAQGLSIPARLVYPWRIGPFVARLNDFDPPLVPR